MLDGLIHLATSNSALRGLVVNRADGQSIQLRSGTGNTIAGNYIGTDVSGTHVFRTIFGFEGEYAGVGVDDNPANSTTGHRIGGVTPAARNLISGNSAGVAFYASAPNNFVEGNLIGTNRAGTQALANRMGVSVEAVGVTVGGAAAGAGNVISGNTAAVEIGSHRRDREQSDRDRRHRHRARAQCGRHSQSPGATTSFAATRSPSVQESTFRAGIGVLIFAPATGNLLSQNSIVSNAALGLDLGGGGVSLNDVPPASDPPDQDTGANNLQNYPTLTSALPVGGGVQVQGTLASTPNSSFRIEFFANRERDENIFTFDGTIKRGMFAEGETYVGFATAITNASGVATFTANLPALPPDQDFITATATDVTNTGGGPRNNTSEFSPVYPLGGPSTVVTNTGEVGVGTLREAIFVANLTPGDDTVIVQHSGQRSTTFLLPERRRRRAGVARQASPSPRPPTTRPSQVSTPIGRTVGSQFCRARLPEITDTIHIDGYTQPGSSRNTLAAPRRLNTVLKIELDGSSVADDGLAPRCWSGDQPRRGPGDQSFRRQWDSLGNRWRQPLLG